MKNLYIDLVKANLNTAKLVKRMVQVKGHNGKNFQRMQWVDPSTDQPVLHSGKRIKGIHNSKTPIANLQPFHSKLGLRHTEGHGLSHQEVEHRHGKTGDVDLSKLTEGTPLYDDTKAIRYSDNLMSQHPYTKEHFDKINTKEHISSVFKNVTKEGLESVFSNPKGKYTADLVQLSVGASAKNKYLINNIDLEWYNKKGDYMGCTSRSVHRDKYGHLHVYNDLTEIEHKHQGKGIGRDEQERSEQLWRYLSDGHPVHLSLEANISIGVYAWALKGYDFEDDDGLDKAKGELSDFLTQNNMDVKSTMEKCGYNSIDDLQHSWQFASLNDGTEYNLLELKGHQGDDLSSKSTGHLGKIFMLGGKSAWNGEKILNGGTEHEEIANIYKKKKKKSTKKVG